MASLKKFPAVFFATPAGNEPVRVWLKKLDDESRKLIREDIATAEFGWPVGIPLCKDLGKGLYEIRSNITDGRIARVIFASIDGEMVLLPGFVKKTKKTPKPDLDLALKRMKEYKS